MTQFEAVKKIPHILGCIDCSHIKIKAPRENKEEYFNRKHCYSLHLQAVVDANNAFIDVFAGEPGSMHDSRDQEITFPNNSVLLGDSAYPAGYWIVGPYKDNGYLNQQRQFNYIHSATRIAVENAFGLLKTRFRRLLHFTEQDNLKTITNLIVCGCILHNICILQNDDIVNQYAENPVDPVTDESYAAPNQPTNRRDALLAELIFSNVIPS